MNRDQRFAQGKDGSPCGQRQAKPIMIEPERLNIYRYDTTAWHPEGDADEDAIWSLHAGLCSSL